MRRFVLGMFAAMGATAALAQPAALEPPPFGETAFLAQPCPPMPEALKAYLASTEEQPKFTPELVAAYQSYQVYARANDWAGQCRYQDDNAKLPGPARVVFMGDSITENWARFDRELFADGVVGRGISGQTTPQMLVRFQQDVVALRPRVVHIMAGTNDVAGNTGPTSDDRFKANITAMVDLAQANGIAVVLASIPPAAAFSWRPQMKPAAKIRELNGWLEGFAKARGATYVDYHKALAGPDGSLPQTYGRDGVHPLRPGYAVMKPLALAAIAKAERARKPAPRR
jgi:lysophospholipase L1-like esterase